MNSGSTPSFSETACANSVFKAEFAGLLVGIVHRLIDRVADFQLPASSICAPRSLSAAAVSDGLAASSPLVVSAELSLPQPASRGAHRAGEQQRQKLFGFHGNAL